MHIDKVTITGADDTINPFDLLPLTREFPYVEWGILVARGWDGKKRFPSREWIDDLVAAQNATIARGAPPIKLSMHVCEAWMKEMLMGLDLFFHEMSPYWQAFQRIQINTHAETLPKNIPAFLDVLAAPTRNIQYILQYDGVNGEELLTAARQNAINAVPLFDLSHGAGVSPDAWPKRIQETHGRGNALYCGYAGGIGPANIEDELKKIETAVDSDGEKHLPIWIDMETRVRTDGKFDLDKVRACLVAAKPYVQS